MLAVGSGFAQAPAAQKKAPAATTTGRWPIEKLVIEGNHNFSVEQVLTVAALRTGQTVGRPELEAAKDRILACGAFDTVSYKFVEGSGKGYVATFTLTEVEQVYPVRFDNLHVSERELVAALKAKDPLFEQGKLPATQPVFARYQKWVTEYLKSKGVEEKISLSVEPDRPGEYVISVHTGRDLPVVALISFVGNQVLTQEKLQDAVLASAVGMPYTEDRFREALNAGLRPLYEARGRVRVSFPSIKTEPNKDVTGLNLTITVDEGEVYKLGAVTIDGATPIKPEELIKTGDFKAGEIANFDKINEGLARMKKALHHDGYLNGQITTRRAIDDEKRTIALTLWIDAGAMYTMRKLTITGLDLNAEAEINRIWTLKAGKPFNPDYPSLFLTKIQEQGMFDNLQGAKADYKVNESDHSADVTLTFKGGASPAGRGGRGGRGEW